MMTRRWVWTVALCAFGASAAVGAELSINLNLAERAGVKRVNQPVAGGIPLPPGAVRNTNRLAVVDAAGRPVQRPPGASVVGAVSGFGGAGLAGDDDAGGVF